MGFRQVKIKASINVTTTETVPAMKEIDASAKVEPNCSLDLFSIEPTILHLYSDYNLQIITCEKVRRIRNFEGKGYEFELEYKIGSLWTIVVESDSKLEAKFTSMRVFEQAIAPIPSNKNSYLCFDSSNIKFEFQVVEDEIAIVDSALYERQCEFYLECERQRRKQLIAQVYGLSVPEFYFCFNDVLNRENSLIERITQVMVSRWG